MSKRSNKARPIFLGAAGSVLLVGGISLVIVWWPQVVNVFKGFIGVALALGGMLMLYMVKE